jgi:PAS domain S-box-containing protein
MPFGRQISLRGRLFLAVAILVGAAAAAPLVFLPDRLEAQARRDIEVRALDIARAYAGAGEVAIDFGDRARAAEVLGGLSATHGALYGLLAQADGSALASWGQVPGRPPAFAPGRGDAVALEDAVLHVRVLVTTRSGEVGSLQLGLDLSELRRRSAESSGLVAFTAGLVFTVGLIAAFLVGTLVLRPLRRLTGLAERIARGDEGAAGQLDVERGDETGAVSAALGSVVERLVEQRAMLQSQSEASYEGILTLGLEGQVLTHNRRLAEIWGLGREALAGVGWPVARALLAERLAGPFPAWLDAPAPVLPEPGHEVADFVLGDGRIIAFYAATVRRPSGEPLGLGLYFRDVTRRVEAERRARELAATLEARVEERTRELAAANAELGRRLEELHRTQEQLVVADRRVSVGRLAAGVAHEVNNPLAYLLANLKFVNADLANLRAALRTTDESVRRAAEAQADEMLEAISEAVQGAERVAHIVRGLKAFSRADEDVRRPVAVAAALDAALDMAGHEVRHRARLVREVEEAPAVLADEVRLSQVFVNLVINAAQAIPAGAADRNAITVRVGTDAEGWAYAEVRDTGCGIPPEVRGRIFDPFFTTKPQGEGTGLGLSICQGIVASLGGGIEVWSEPGRGSTFRVRLPPCGPGREQTPTPSPGAEPPPGPPRRILVVDDEPYVAAALGRLLGQGHDVVAVVSAGEALERIRAGQRFDRVLCDLMMPVMSGMEFHDELLRAAPEVAASVTFMSGGAFTEAARDFAERNRHRFLEKPLDLDELRRAIA